MYKRLLFLMCLLTQVATASALLLYLYKLFYFVLFTKWKLITTIASYTHSIKHLVLPKWHLPKFLLKQGPLQKLFQYMTEFHLCSTIMKLMYWFSCSIFLLLLFFVIPSTSMVQVACAFSGCGKHWHDRVKSIISQLS